MQNLQSVQLSNIIMELDNEGFLNRYNNYEDEIELLEQELIEYLEQLNG